jgi:ectoine hydroxylase-related dioxygenase (phytanoyl-CoA dioxygenase family)
MATTITDAQCQQYREEGYFILEKVVPDDQLQILRIACEKLIRLADEELDRLGVDHNHITHRGVRYHIAKKYDQAEGLSDFVFGDLMADICKATIGLNAYLFYDQYVVKCAEKGIHFSWHQDSGYLGFPHTPYVTCWTAVDDMTLENGTAYVMPFSTIGIKTLVEHVRDPKTGDKTGYFGKAQGVPAIVPAGSVVVFSSLSFHRSGANTTDRMRRAYVTQYAPAEIMNPDTGELMHLAVPFLAEGRRVDRANRAQHSE